MKGLSGPAFVDKTKVDVTYSFDSRVLNTFRQEFNPLRELAFQFRNILFYWHLDSKSLEALKELELSKQANYKLGTPTGDDARCRVYDRIIKVFDDCIANSVGNNPAPYRPPENGLQQAGIGHCMQAIGGL